MKISSLKFIASQQWLGLLFLLPLLSLAGCASQYDCYPCGQVSCHYCPPKPMPTTDYPSSNCNDSIGQVYMANLPTQNYSHGVPVNAGVLEVDRPGFEVLDEKTHGASDEEPSGKAKYP